MRAISTFRVYDTAANKPIYATIYKQGAYFTCSLLIGAFMCLQHLFNALFEDNRFLILTTNIYVSSYIV